VYSQHVVVSRDADQEQCPAAAPAETTAERTDLNEDGPSEAPEEAPVVIHIQATPVNHVGRVVVEPCC